MSVGSRLRAASRFVPATTVLLALLVLAPALPSPFHTPKRWVLLTGAAVGLLASAPRWQWSALPWLIASLLPPWTDSPAALQAIALALALLGWTGLGPPLAASRRLVLAGATLVAGIVLLQSVGWDPFSRARPDTGARLALYGTLGNPDFVASCLLPIAILGLAEERWRWRVALVVVAFALAATRSFATMAALVAGGVALVIHPAARRRPRIAISLGIVLFLLIPPLLHRSPGGAAAGRLYLTKIAAPHVRDAPIGGLGAGSFVRLWPEWELRWWQERCADAQCVSAHPDGRFAGRQDHVHNDWLEILLERGTVGLAALALALLHPLRTLWRRRDEQAALLLAALVALLSRALVDFPFARPADLCLLAFLVSLSLSPERESACVPSPSPSAS